MAALDAAPNIFNAADSLRWRGIQAVDCHHYFDTVKFLSKAAISETDQEFLRSHCKHFDLRAHGEMVFPKRGKPYQINIHPWRFRIEMHLPDAAALGYFAKRRGLKLTRADLARDFTFDDAQGKLRMLEIFEQHFVQPRQRKYQRISFDNGGLSTGRRSRGHFFTFYVSRECRIDGVVDCFHAESRNLGAKALAQIGLHHPRDLLDFDHAKYWQRIECQFLSVDKERLGRFHRNRHAGEHRRSSDPQRYLGRRSEDHAIGALLYRIHGIDPFGIISVQSFIRNYGRGPFLLNLGSDRMNAKDTVDTARAGITMEYAE